MHVILLIHNLTNSRNYLQSSHCRKMLPRLIEDSASRKLTKQDKIMEPTLLPTLKLKHSLSDFVMIANVAHYMF